MSVDRLEKEKSFHDRVFEGSDPEREKADKYYLVNRYSKERYVEIISQHCQGKKLLEYGCGTGSESERWLQFGAILTGIDISPEGIKKAKERIANTEYSADYLVRNAESTGFDDDSFDVVVGTSIIHHLDLAQSYQELCRILKKDGCAVFLEPLGHNPIINLYRILTPRMRTEDEHPLMLRDIKLLHRYFQNVDVEFFSLFTLLAVPFRNMSVFDSVCTALRSIDRAVFRIPFLQRYAWTTVIQASNPRK